MLSLDKLCNFVECCMLCDYFEYICRLLDGCMAYCRCNFDKLSVCTKGFYYFSDHLWSCKCSNFFKGTSVQSCEPYYCVTGHEKAATTGARSTTTCNRPPFAR